MRVKALDPITSICFIRVCIYTSVYYLCNDLHNMTYKLCITRLLKAFIYNLTVRPKLHTDCHSTRFREPISIASRARQGGTYSMKRAENDD